MDVWREKREIKDGTTVFEIDPKQGMSEIEKLMTREQIAEAQLGARAGGRELRGEEQFSAQLP